MQKSTGTISIAVPSAAIGPSGSSNRIPATARAASASVAPSAATAAAYTHSTGFHSPASSIHSQKSAIHQRIHGTTCRCTPLLFQLPRSTNEEPAAAHGGLSSPRSREPQLLAHLHAGLAPL